MMNWSARNFQFDNLESSIAHVTELLGCRNILANKMNLVTALESVKSEFSQILQPQTLAGHTPVALGHPPMLHEGANWKSELLHLHARYSAFVTAIKRDLSANTTRLNEMIIHILQRAKHFLEKLRLSLSANRITTCGELEIYDRLEESFKLCQIDFQNLCLVYLPISSKCTFILWYFRYGVSCNLIGNSFLHWYFEIIVVMWKWRFKTTWKWESVILQRRRQNFGSGGGNILGGRPRMGSGGGAALRTPENAENFQKISKEHCKKWIILGDLKNIQNPALNYCALD